MMESPALLWLLLRQQLKLSPSVLRQLMALATDPRRLAAALHHDSPPPLKALAEQVETTLNRAGAVQVLRQRLVDAECEVLCLVDDDYPALLAEIHDPPPLLFIRGRRDLLSRPMIAVVGSRRCSKRGIDDARQFAAALAECGMGVASGMALGIDANAHWGALQAGGATVAVLGCGVDVCYPRGNRALYEELSTQAAIVSEYDPGAPPLRHQFPQRNRIISGLSLGVLVVEAAVQSGSLITARQALEQNREVFALPGSLHNPSNRGCNALIKQGAKLVETTADILEEFVGWTLHAGQQDTVPEPESQLLRLLDFAPQALDVLAARSAMPVPNLLAELSELEVAGWVEQRAGALLRRR